MSATVVRRPGVFLRRDPQEDRAPLLVEIPRSGSEYPRAFQSPAAFDAVHRSISMYVEELWEGCVEAGATWLFACFPNAWIDANRNELDIDPDLLAGPWPGELRPTEKSRLGIGLIHRVCGTGDVPLHGRRLRPEEVRERLDGYYWPYHREVAAILLERHREFGLAYHVSCHSMASVGGAATLDRGARRSDFDIGDGNGKTCEPEAVALVAETLRGFGHEVTVNRHYAGAECIHKHARPLEGIHSMQIEINRGLYMDEERFVRRPIFAELQQQLQTVSAALAAHAREKAARGGAG